MTRRRPSARTSIAQAGRTKRFMGGDQRKSEARYKKVHETVTRNVVTSGTEAEGFEHFMRTTAKGLATETVSDTSSFCTCKVPLPQDHTWTTWCHFLRWLAWQDEVAICCFCKRRGSARRARARAQATHAERGVLDICKLSGLCIDCASRIKGA